MVTSLCNRDCKYCCNKQYDLNDIPYVTDEELREAETLCITGGEPFAFTKPGDVSYDVMPLAEPNGLYASPSTSATWILTCDDSGDIKPIYVESEITVCQTKIDARLCEDWSLTEDY